MSTLQVADLPGWLPYREAVVGLPDTAVQVAIFALVALAVAGTGAFVVAPTLRLFARRFDAHDRLLQFLSRLTTTVATIVGVLAGLVVAGFDLAAGGMIVLLLIGIVGLALSADDLVRDVVGGVFLLLTQPFVRGDWIAVEDVEGRVERVGVRTTAVRTFDNETVTVPNSTLNEEPVTNRSAQDELRQTFRFGVGYDEDLSQAMEATLMAAREVEGIAAEPVPEVRAVDLDPSWVTLRATVWLNDPTRLEYVDTRSRFVRAVKAGLMANDIDINPQKTELSGQIGTAEVDTDNAVTERGQN